MPPRARATAPSGTVSAGGLAIVRCDVVSTESMMHLVEGCTQEFMATAGFFGMLAPTLQARIEYQLHKEGLDQAGRFARFVGTSAERAARDITNPFFKVADGMVEMAQAVQLAGQMWHSRLAEPIQAARNARDEVDVLQV